MLKIKAERRSDEITGNQMKRSFQDENEKRAINENLEETRRPEIVRNEVEICFNAPKIFFRIKRNGEF